MTAASPLKESFFSVSHALILTDVPLPYDLYINSSSLENRERFVRIFPRGELFTRGDLDNFRRKYRQLYISEEQRTEYIQSICKSSGKQVEEKAAVLKDSAIHYLTTLFDGKTTFSAEVLNQTLEGCRDVVDNMVDVLSDVTVDTLKDLIGNLSFHDFYTYDHSINVSMYCILLYRELNPEATRGEIVEAGMGGLLHDIGKIKVPTHIINKPGKLSPDEWAEIQKHPDYGRGALAMGGVQFPEAVDPDTIQRVVFEHHECFDGTGYPCKIQGESIHLLARVTAIADFFDAITTKRSYNDPLSVGNALALMAKSKGKKLDPKIFDIFAKLTAEKFDPKANLHEMPTDFDPCQPRAGGFQKKVQVVEDKPPQAAGYGKIKVIGSAAELKDWAAHKNVTLIQSAPKKNPKKAG